MKLRGFTLIELMVAMVVFLLLASLAYPSYSGYVLKARRVEGQVALLEVMQKQERHFSQHNTYVAFSSDSASPDAALFKWYSGSSAPVSAYELRGLACPDQPIERCIELRAMPGTQLVDSKFKDRDCETLTLTSTGEYRASGSARRCWP